MEKVALVTIASPNDILQGTVVEQRKIAEYREGQWLTWIALKHSATEDRSAIRQIRPVRIGPWSRPFRFFTSRIGDCLLDILWSRIAAAKISTFCEKDGIRRIWAVTEPLAQSVALRAARMTGLPLHVTIHDHPFRTHQLTHDRPEWYWRTVERNCIALLRAADSVDVVSRSLKNYALQYADCPVNLYLPSVPAVAGCVRPRADGNIVRIGFNGNMHTGPEEVRVFLRWLKMIGRKYEFHIFGERSFVPEVFPELAELGSVVRHAYEPDYGKYVRSLTEMDAFYIGAWFAHDKDLTVRYSFPSKISAILSVGVPLICHGPDHWELASWLKEISFGVHISSMDTSSVPAVLNSFITDDAGRKPYQEGAKIMFEKWLRLPDDPGKRNLPWESA